MLISCARGMLSIGMRILFVLVGVAAGQTINGGRDLPSAEIHSIVVRKLRAQRVCNVAMVFKLILLVLARCFHVHYISLLGDPSHPSHDFFADV
jgi:hypothetical protein